jgi:hypothetical protein
MVAVVDVNNDTPNSLLNIGLVDLMQSKNIEKNDNNNI